MTGTRTAELLILLYFIALGASPTFASSDFAVDSIIHLRKNTNGNQVHYGVRVDGACRPLAENPVHPYWRMLEVGEGETQELRFWERPGYGVIQPEKVERTQSGGEFEFRIRGVKERLIRVETFRSNAECRARATTEIDSAPAIFQHIEITVSGWATVHRVEIFGSTFAGDAVHEVTFQDDGDSP